MLLLLPGVTQKDYRMAHLILKKSNIKVMKIVGTGEEVVETSTNTCLFKLGKNKMDTSVKLY